MSEDSYLNVKINKPNRNRFMKRGIRKRPIIGACISLTSKYDLQLNQSCFVQVAKTIKKSSKQASQENYQKLAPVLSLEDVQGNLSDGKTISVKELYDSGIFSLEELEEDYRFDSEFDEEMSESGCFEAILANPKKRDYLSNPNADLD